MSKRFVYGAYSTLDEAEIVANDLMTRGVDESSMSIIANNTSDATTTSNYPVTIVNHEENPEADKTWWDNLLGFFTSDNDEITSETAQTELGNDYSEYQSALREGQYLLILDKRYDNLIESNGENNIGQNTRNPDMTLTDEERATEIDHHQVTDDDTGMIRDPHIPVSGTPFKSTTLAEDLMNDPDVPDPFAEDTNVTNDERPV